MANKFENIQVQFQVRNARKRGPTSSDEYNDMLAELASDLTTLTTQWNNRLVPLGDAIPDGTVDSSVDAYTNGLDGANLYVNHDATASSNSLYWNAASGRPNTVAEQFDSFNTTMGEIRDDLENQINNSGITASQVAVVDSSHLYSAKNVEAALAEVMTTVNSLSLVSFGSVRENIIPYLDNTYTVGSSAKRFSSMYVGPSSFHIRGLAAEVGGTIRDYTLGINTSSGFLEVKEQSTTIATFTSAGRVGVGTGSPSVMMEVSGTDPKIRSTDSAGSGSYMEIYDGGVWGHVRHITPSGSSAILLDPIASDNTSGAEVYFLRNVNTSGSKRIRFYKGDASATVHVQIGVDGANTYFSGGGDFGIGTSSPDTEFEVEDTLPHIRLTSTSTGRSALIQTLTGIEILCAGMNTGAAKWTPALKFGSTDTAFTTTNPKFLAMINGRATENYDADTDAGMALDFATTANNAGASPTPTVRMTIDNDGDVGFNQSSPSAKIHVSTETDEGHEAMILDQNDADQAFVDFQGTTGASATATVSTWTSGNTIQGFLQVEVNGSKYWIPYYNDPTS